MATLHPIRNYPKNLQAKEYIVTPPNTPYWIEKGLYLLVHKDENSRISNLDLSILLVLGPTYC